MSGVDLRPLWVEAAMTLGPSVSTPGDTVKVAGLAAAARGAAVAEVNPPIGPAGRLARPVLDHQRPILETPPGPTSGGYVMTSVEPWWQSSSSSLKDGGLEEPDKTH